MHRQNIRSLVFFAAQTRCISAGEMHRLIESVCASSLALMGVDGIADGMTSETEVLYCTHVNQKHKYLGKENDETCVA